MANDESISSILPKDVKGLRYFKALGPLLKRLQKVGKERDKANSRHLHMDQYCTLILLWLYSPIVDSLRGLQQASQLKKVQKKFGVARTSLGSLSESVSIFDPEPLKQIANELAPADIVAGGISDQTDQAYLLDDLLLHERLGKP